MATHSSVLAWRIPGTGEPGGLPSMGSHRVRHDWSNLAAAAAAWNVRASLVAQLVKNLPANAGDLVSIPGSGKSPGEGNGNSLQYSCLENPMDRGAWQAAAHEVEGVRRNLATKPPPQPERLNRLRFLLIRSHQATCTGLLFWNHIFFLRIRK